MDFRQNPDNMCQLQYRKKSTDTWSLAFDYSLCEAITGGSDTLAQYRYAADGTLERSTDGGATYQPANQYDTRFTSTQFPPVSGDNGREKRCIAAAGMAALMKTQVANQLTDGDTQYTLVELINDWVKTMLESGGNVFQALVTIAANQTFALGVAALRAALTDGVWDTMQCIFFCNMADDASFNAAKWQSVKSDVSAQIGGIAGAFLGQLVNLLGPAGLTNLARSGSATSADCSACDCNNCAADPVIPLGGGTLNAQDGCNLNISSAPEGDHYAVYLWFNNHTGTFDATKCGSVAYWNAESGTVTNTGRNDCNTGAYNGGFALGQCGSQFYWAGPAPFTLAIEVAACPP